MIIDIIIGMMLGVSLFKIGELAIDIISKSRFRIGGFDESLLDKKKTS